MILDQLINKVEFVKNVWVRKKGKLRRLSIPSSITIDASDLTKPLFPISKERE